MTDIPVGSVDRLKRDGLHAQRSKPGPRQETRVDRKQGGVAGIRAGDPQFKVLMPDEMTREVDGLQTDRVWVLVERGLPTKRGILVEQIRAVVGLQLHPEVLVTQEVTRKIHGLKAHRTRDPAQA